jgi:hypothetical protein
MSKCFPKLSMVVDACNPSYLEGRDQEDYGSRPAQANSQEDPISTHKLGVMGHACYPSNTGGFR